MSTPIKITHPEQGEERLTSQWANSPNVKALLDSWQTSLESVEDTLFDLLNERSITTAVGEQLDVIGRIVGEDRQGKSDDFYRSALMGRIVANTSDCTTEAVLTSLRTVCGTEGVNFFEHYPSELHMWVDSGSNNNTALALDNACGAGINTRILQDLNQTMFLATEFTTIEDVILEMDDLDIFNVIDASSNLYELKMDDIFGASSTAERAVFPEINGIETDLLVDGDLVELTGWTTLTGSPSVNAGVLTLSSASITQSITTVASQVYDIMASASAASSGMVIKVGTTSGGAEIATLTDLASLESETKLLSFTATGTTTWITLIDAADVSTIESVHLGSLSTGEARKNPLCDVTGYEQFSFMAGTISDGTDTIITDDGTEIKYITD